VRELVGLEEDTPLIVILEGLAKGFAAANPVDDGDRAPFDLRAVGDPPEPTRRSLPPPC
jgi:hypothetical protein